MTPALCEERARFTEFKRSFRNAHPSFAKQRGNRYYNTVRSAYLAQTTGSTLDRWIRPRSYGGREGRLSLVGYDEVSGSGDADDHARDTEERHEPVSDHQHPGQEVRSVGIGSRVAYAQAT